MAGEMTPTEKPDAMATYILGAVAVLKALVPVLMKLIASSDDAKMTAISSSNAGLLWWVGNFMFWAPLAVMWPLTYGGTSVDLYLMLTLYLGLYGGALLALVNAIIFAISDSSKATLYLILVIIIDIPGVALTYLYF